MRIDESITVRARPSAVWKQVGDPGNYAGLMHGMTRWQFDPSAGVIWMLEKCGLAWDVVRISPDRQASKLLA